jgi:hypothetical protein
MNKLTAFGLACALGFSSAHAQLRPAGEQGYDVSERALESASVRFFLRPDGSGSAVARECNECTPVRLLVTPNMQVTVAGNVVDWDQGLQFGKQTVDIFYDHDSKQIARIVAP